MEDSKDKLNVTQKMSIVYLILAVVIFGFILLNSDVFSHDYLSVMTEFDDEWEDEAGNTYRLTDIKSSDFNGGVITLSKRLPYYLFDGDYICFESKNAEIKFYLDNRRVYEFNSKKNFTGRGYGVAFHKVGVSREDAGKIITIQYTGINDGTGTGRVFRMYLGAPADYIRWTIYDRAVLLASSVLLSFFGLVLLILWLGIPNKNRQPFNICAFGVASFSMGLWCLINTNVIQLLFEHYYFWNTLGVVIIPMIGYPFVVFFNSITKRKKSIYNILAFSVSVGAEVTMIILRYVADRDMVNTVAWFSLLVLICDVVIMLGAYLENKVHCKELGIPTDFKAINIAIAVLTVATAIDVVVFLKKNEYTDTYGTFMRFGLIIFDIIMIMQFVSWWTMDVVAMDRDRFVNRALQFAATSRNPVESIKLLLEYLGKELEAKRTYIFEISDSNTVSSIYEWFEDGLVPMNQEIYELGTENEIAKMKKIVDEMNKTCFVINDAEKIKDISGFTYQLMKRLNLSNVVFSPIKSGDDLVGFVGITDISIERQAGVNEIMKVLPYFFSQFINQRKEQDRIVYYSYHDAISGALNRTALKEFISEKLDLSQAFGYVMCEIPGLKEINTKLGHDVGDALVKNTSKSMMDVLGDNNVYRLAGETFVGFGFENDEYFFDNDVQMIKRRFANEESDVLLAALYCSNGATSLEMLENHANEILKQERKKLGKSKGE